MRADDWGQVRWHPFRLGALELAVASTPRDAWTGPRLTAAEWAVGRRVAAGATNREIARTRRTSIHTTSNQVSRLFRKVGVGSRLEFAAAFGGLAARGTAPRGGREISIPSEVAPGLSAEDHGRQLRLTAHALLESLRARAVAVDAASGAASDARRAWAQLCSGKWSVIESFDGPGRSYLVLHRMRRSRRRRHGLTAREQRVLSEIALGRSSTAVAAGLGLAPSTVSSLIAELMACLGLARRVAIAQLIGPFARAVGRLEPADGRGAPMPIADATGLPTPDAPRNDGAAEAAAADARASAAALGVELE